jgi:uncharacterized RDD family membrane protein YckC
VHLHPWVTDHRSAPDTDGLLGRRLAAGVVDLGVVLATALVSAAALGERFTIIQGVDGQPVITPSEQARVTELVGPLSRAYRLGDTLLAFSTPMVVAAAISAMTAAVLVGVMVPAVTGGQSIGKKLFGLRVVSLDGVPPPLARHVMRTAAGLADLMPVVLPGLTGLAVAAFSPARQRIGDRVAKTIVVDARCLPAGSGSPPAAAAGAPGIPVAATPRFGPPVAHPRHQLSGQSASKLKSGSQKPDQKREHGLVAGRTAPSRSQAPDGSTRRGAGYQRHGDRTDMSDNDNVGRQQNPSVAPATVRRVPVEDRSTNPYPKPVRPAREARDEMERSAHLDPAPQRPVETPIGHNPAGYDSLALPESSLSDMPLTNSALLEALGLTADDIAKLDAELDAELDQNDSVPAAPSNVHDDEITSTEEPSVRPLKSRRRADKAAMPTRDVAGPSTGPGQPDPADVTRPAVAAAGPETQTRPETQTGPIQHAATTDVTSTPSLSPSTPTGRRQADPSLSVASLPQPAQRPQPVQAAPVQQPVQRGPASQTVQIATESAERRQASAPAPDKRSPIWSEDWEAWIYWDTTLRHWFRHDEDTDNWVPMEDA